MLSRFLPLSSFFVENPTATEEQEREEEGGSSDDGSICFGRFPGERKRGGRVFYSIPFLPPLLLLDSRGGGGGGQSRFAAGASSAHSEG